MLPDPKTGRPAKTLVCHDYGTNMLFEHGMTRHMAARELVGQMRARRVTLIGLWLHTAARRFAGFWVVWCAFAKAMKRSGFKSSSRPSAGEADRDYTRAARRGRGICWPAARAVCSIPGRPRALRSYRRLVAGCRASTATWRATARPLTRTTARRWDEDGRPAVLSALRGSTGRQGLPLAARPGRAQAQAGGGSGNSSDGGAAGAEWMSTGAQTTSQTSLAFEG